MKQEPSDPESLWGKIDPKSFSDRAVRSRPPQLEADDDAYLPKTKETCTAYEGTLGVIKQQLDDQPLGIVNDAANQILAILLSNAVENLDKKKEIDKLLNLIPNHIFDPLVLIVELISDYFNDYRV